MYIEPIQTALTFRKNELVAFLKKQNLVFEDVERTFGVFSDAHELIGTGSRNKNIFKLFAVDPAYQSMGVMELLIQKLLEDAMDENIKEIFVYTNVDLIPMFESFHFKNLANTDKTSLLFKGKDVYEYLEALNVPELSGVVGAVVMNANPFTKGHEYLIDQALLEVDWLLFFLVEENVSFFSFKDRLIMAELGVYGKERVIVRPSTSFLISRATFPSYFLKEKQLIDEEHAKIDAMVFRDYFVPFFQIDKRFLGSEPLDESTLLYNNILSHILGKEIDVKIIDRLELDGEVVSASRVRKNLVTREYEAIKPLVTEDVYAYLIEHYGHITG